MANKPRVTTRDKGYNKLLRSVVRAQSGALSIGVHPREGRQRYPSGRTVSEVARLHASGTRRMPRRDPVGDWFAQGGQRKIQEATRRALDESLRTGKSPRRRLERAGMRYVQQVLAEFARQHPLARSTIERKGSSKILVERGLLERSITFRVRIGKGAGTGTRR